MLRRKSLGMALCGILIVPAAGLWTGGCNVEVGSGPDGAFISFEIAGKTFVLGFGELGRIPVAAGETASVPTTRAGVFERASTDTPPSATMRLPSDSVGTFRRAAAKAIVHSQALPLSGSATVGFLVASGDSTDPCNDGVLAAEYDVSFTAGITAVLNEVFELSDAALAIVLTNDVTFCIQIIADFDADFTIGDIEIAFGGGTETGQFELINADTIENIHILLPDEDFDTSNRLTPGSSRTATVSRLGSGSTVQVRAGRNGTVLDSTTCPTVEEMPYSATVTWDGRSVTCIATSGGDSGTTIPPGTSLQVPIDSPGGLAVSVLPGEVYNGIDYAIVGVLGANTPDAPSSPDPSSVTIDLAALGLASVDEIFMAVVSAWIPDLPNGVTLATLTCDYAEGGVPTTMDFTLGSTTSEWSYLRPEHDSLIGGVAHDSVPVLYSFPTTIDSAFEYDGWVYDQSLLLDSSRTLMMCTLTAALPSTFPSRPLANEPTWGGTSILGLTLVGPAGIPSTTGGDGGAVLCDEQADCAPDEICMPDGVCIPGDIGGGDGEEPDIEDPVTTNGDFDDEDVTLIDTAEAEIMCRTGDIDNLGFGWPAGFDPFSGDTTPIHTYPWEIDTTDPPGTDRIMVVSSYVGNPPAGLDGYTGYTSRPDNVVESITLNCDLGGVTVSGAILQIFVDDFQAPTWGASYEVTLDGQRATFLEDIINSLTQGGPIGQLITLDIPSEFLNLLSDGRLELRFDDNTTGAGDGYAIDFVKLLINPGTVVRTGTATGTVVDDTTGLPIAGALVSAGGIIEALTDAAGQYVLNSVAAGLVILRASADAYESKLLSAELVTDGTVAVDFRLTPGGDGSDEGCVPDGVCDAGCPVDNPDPDCAEVCIADGFCNENCADVDPDPDCSP